METKKFVYYEENGTLVGWLEEYPDYRTQGESMDELRDEPAPISTGIVTSGEVPCVRRVGELSIA